MRTGFTDGTNRRLPRSLGSVKPTVLRVGDVRVKACSRGMQAWVIKKKRRDRRRLGVKRTRLAECTQYLCRRTWERSVVFPPLTISRLCLEYVVSNETGQIDDEKLLTHMNESH